MLNFNQTIKANTDEFVARLEEAGWTHTDAVKEACEQLHKEYWRQISHDFNFNFSVKRKPFYQDFECNACCRKFREEALK